MLRHGNIDRIACIVLAVTILLTCGYMGAAAAGWIEGDTSIGYENRLFDQSRVHTIDIVMDDWDGFLETCTSEEYASCTLVIDGEAYKNVAIRGKGNTSLSSVASYGNDRYSFKIEFDHYEKGKTYHGLDKLCLNNLIQDTTFMKDYLAYTLMGKMGVASPLTSFVQINVNGEAWGLYLAVEAVEDSFLLRNYGSSYGELYKPDSMSFGGGRGNGRDFDMDELREKFFGEAENAQSGGEAEGEPSQENLTERMGKGRRAEDGAQQNGADFGNMPGGMGSMGSSDVMLQYSGEEPENYSNIFDNAKTDISEADQKRLIEALRKLSEGESIEEKLEAVDAEAVIRYLVVHNFLVNGDSYTGSMVHNYYLYEKDGVLSMIPWDYNLAMGAFDMGGFGRGSGATSAVNSPIDSPVSSGDISSRPIIAWIFESEEYTALYHEIYAEFIETVFNSGWMAEELERVTNMIAPYVEQDENAFFSYEEFLTASDTLNEFMTLRAESISGQLDGRIPSTTEGQNGDSSALVDASHINVSDMGSMGNMGGGAQGGMTPPEGFDPTQMQGGMTMPDGEAGTLPEGFDPTQMQGGMTPPDGEAGTSSGENAGSERTEGKAAFDSGETSEDEAMENFVPGRDMFKGFEAEQQNGMKEEWIMLLASCAVLAAGIAAAAFWRSGR